MDFEVVEVEDEDVVVEELVWVVVEVEGVLSPLVVVVEVSVLDDDILVFQRCEWR